MGVRFPTAFSNAIVNGTIVTTAETVVATTPPLSLSLDNQPVLLWAYVAWSVGTGTTTVILSLRRGTSTAGALLVASGNDSLIQISASGNTKSIQGVDANPGAGANLQYSLTVTQNAAGGNGTVFVVAMLAMAL